MINYIYHILSIFFLVIMHFLSIPIIPRIIPTFLKINHEFNLVQYSNITHQW